MMGWFKRLWRRIFPAPQLETFNFEIRIHPDAEPYFARHRLAMAEKKLRLAANAFAMVVIGALREEC